MTMNNTSFHGPLAEYLNGYLEQKKSLGFAYTEETRTAHVLDDMSLLFNCKTGIPDELIYEFTKPQPNWQATTQKRRLAFFNGLGRYMIAHGVIFSPNAIATVRKCQTTSKPYILSKEEILQLWDIVDNIHPTWRNTHIFYPVFFRLLYATGMRVGEAIFLRINDVDFDNNTILIRKPKNLQDRLIPVDPSIMAYLNDYKQKVHKVFRPEDLFFVTVAGKPYDQNNINCFFKSCMDKMNLPSGGYKDRMRGPHLHCLRHTFAVHSLSAMLKRGISHYVALPYLCAYLGHSSLSSTELYLQLTADAYPDLQKTISEIYKDIYPQIVREETENGTEDN